MTIIIITWPCESFREFSVMGIRSVGIEFIIEVKM